MASSACAVTYTAGYSLLRKNLRKSFFNQKNFLFISFHKKSYTAANKTSENYRVIYSFYMTQCRYGNETKM